MMNRKDLLDLLIEKKLTLSSMESLTGGLFASTFTSIPGASKVFQGSAVTYQDKVKESYGVKKSTIETYGAISAQCAKEMALCASTFFKTDIAISFTGNAGPDNQEEKPVGLVYISIKLNNIIHTFELHLQGEREEIRKQSVDFAFNKLFSYLQEIQ